MNKFIVATLFSSVVTSASAKDILYPREACAEIVSSEYSTGGGDSAFEMFEILCKSDDGSYTTFVTSWTSVSGFLGLGRVAYESRINLIPYDGRELKAK